MTESPGCGSLSLVFTKEFYLSRHSMITVHLALAAVFLPFMLLMPLSGGLYLLDIKGGQEKVEAFRIEEPVPEKPDDFFRRHFRARDLDFDFEYIRSSGKDFIFRPTSRVHYSATQSETGAVVYRIEPDLIRRLIEIHKGHGPLIIRWLQVAFALALILVTLSGVYLAVQVPPYRRVLGYGFLLGVIILAVGLL